MRYKRTLGNHRRFKTAASTKQRGKLKVGYARVSSQDQKEDLQRQRETIEKHTAPDLMFSDIGSGMNYKKPGLRKLVALLLSGKVRELVIAYKDRLLRFGSELVFMVCKHLGVKVTILNEEKEVDSNQQLCQDVIEIMTVFCSKIYGQRSHKHRKNRENTSLSGLPTENDQLCSSL